MRKRKEVGVAGAEGARGDIVGDEDLIRWHLTGFCKDSGFALRGMGTLRNPGEADVCLTRVVPAKNELFFVIPVK